MGIVTKLGMTLMPNPGDYESFVCSNVLSMPRLRRGQLTDPQLYTFPNEADLAPLVDIIRPLRIANILENVAQLRHVLQAVALLGKPRSTFFKHGEEITDERAREIARRELNYGDFTWLYYGMSYGPKQIRQYKLEIVEREFMKIAGARRIDPATLPRDDYFWSRDQIAAGVPDLEELRWVNWHPNGGHIAFSPVSPVRGTDATTLWRIARGRAAEHGLEIFPAFCVGLREMHLIVEAVYDRDDADARRRARACMRAMIDEAAAHGYGEYRTHLVLMDQIADTYSWNNHALMRFNERIKDALDPNGILAPGKSGVWPARYRGRGWEMTRQDERSEGDGVHRGGANL